MTTQPRPTATTSNRPARVEVIATLKSLARTLREDSAEQQRHAIETFEREGVVPLNARGKESWPEHSLVHVADILDSLARGLDSGSRLSSGEIADINEATTELRNAASRVRKAVGRATEKKRSANGRMVDFVRDVALELFTRNKLTAGELAQFLAGPRRDPFDPFDSSVLGPVDLDRWTKAIERVRDDRYREWDVAVEALPRGCSNASDQSRREAAEMLDAIAHEIVRSIVTASGLQGSRALDSLDKAKRRARGR